MKDKKTLVAILGILGIIIATVGITYAFFSYSRMGNKINSIKSGNITFKYTENSRGINIGDAMPMTDAQGKVDTNYFDFTIDSKTSDIIDIPYYITVDAADSNLTMFNIVKLYLTKVDNQGNETGVINPTKFSELGTYTNTDGINIPVTEKLVYSDRVFAGESSYTQKYRLRMWIDYDADYVANNYNDLDFKITVNVYSTGKMLTSNQVNYREIVDINDITIGNNTLTTNTTTFNGTEEIQVGETTIQKTITVNTVNPDSNVTIENLTPTSMNSKTQKLSTNLTLDLVLGTNTFKITVSSITGKSHKEYNLIIVAQYPSYIVEMEGSNLTFGKSSISVRYQGSNTVTVTPASGYYLASASCTNGYTTNATTGTGATGQQTVTVSNNGNVGESTCTFTVTPRTYTITYNLNDGTQGSNPVNSYTIETETFSLPIPTKTGYTFGGWYTNSNFTGSAVTQIAKGTTGNKIYYAKWTADTYEVTIGTDSNLTKNKSKVNVVYNGTGTVEITPANGYYLASASCTNSYTTNATIGTSATAKQTITISNNGNIGASVCTFTSAINIYTSSAEIVANVATTSTKKVIACDTVGTNQYNNCGIYSTLQDAFDSRNNGYVVMTANLSANDTTLATGKTFILDLYGKTLTSSNLGILNSGILTINNSTTTIGGISSVAAALRNEVEGASLTVNKGNYTANGTGGAAVINAKYGTIIINDGTFTKSGVGTVICDNTVSPNVKVYIYGGTFNVSSGSSADVIGTYYSSIQIFVYGGTFTNNGTGKVISNNSDAYIYIKNGTFTAANNHVVANTSNGIVELDIYESNKSATFVATSTDANANYNALYNSGTGYISVYAENNAKLYLKSVAGVTVLNAATQASRNEYNIYIGGTLANNCTATPSDTTVGTCVYNSSVEAIKNISTGKIRITGATIIADNSYVVNNEAAGTVEISSGAGAASFKGYYKSATNYAIYNTASGTINITASRANNCTGTMSDTTSGLCACSYGATIYNKSSGIITVNGGTYNNINGSGAAVNNYANGTAYLKNATFIGGGGVIRNGGGAKGQTLICSSTIDASSTHFMNVYSGDLIKYYNITFKGVSTSRVDGNNLGTIQQVSSCPF